jgi:hypothetical protein
MSPGIDESSALPLVIWRVVMLNKVKHLAIAREILRCAQNDIVHHLTSDRAIGGPWQIH